MKTNELSRQMVLFRAKNRLTQQALADMCGVSKQTISLVERGLQDPNRVTAAKIMLVIEPVKIDMVKAQAEAVKGD